MLVCHSKTAQSLGVPADNILIIDNGDVVELTPDSIRKGDPVKAGIELLDASRNGIVDARVLKERQQLAEDGVITLLAVISTDGVMAAPPRANLRGVVTTADPRKLSSWAEREIGWVLENRWSQLCRNTGGSAPDVDWVGVQREVEVGLQRRLRRELQVEPLIICVVQPAPAGTPAYKGRADAEPDTRPAPRGGRDGGGRRDVVRDSSGRAPLPQRQLATVGAPASAGAAPAPEVAAASAVAAPAVSLPVASLSAVAAPAVSVPVVKAAPVEEIEPEPAGRIRRRRSAAAE
jgi:ribonuclease J